LERVGAYRGTRREQTLCETRVYTRVQVHTGREILSGASL